MARLRGTWIAALTIVGWTLSTPVMAHGEQGLWPLDASEPITYFIAEGPPESGFKEGDRTLAEWALQAWSRQADLPVKLVPGPAESATIRIYWVPAGAGLYGEMRG